LNSSLKIVSGSAGAVIESVWSLGGVHSELVPLGVIVDVVTFAVTIPDVAVCVDVVQVTIHLYCILDVIAVPNVYVGDVCDEPRLAQVVPPTGLDCHW
jgi:hypothetical protein